MREDTCTNDVEAAAAYERLRGMDDYDDERPTASDLEHDARWNPRNWDYRGPWWPYDMTSGLKEGA